MNDLLLKKVNEVIKLDFVGNYLFADEEEDMILEETNKIFCYICCNRGDKILNKDYNLVFVALVIVTKHWNSSKENFFNNIYRHFLTTKQADELNIERRDIRACLSLKNYQRKK